MVLVYDPKQNVGTVGIDVLVRHYSSHFRLHVSLLLHYFNNRLPDYTVSQPRTLQHKFFHQAPRLSTVGITPPICHTHARSPASSAVDALLGRCEVTEFRDNVSVLSSTVNQSNSFWTAWPLNMGLMLSRNDGNKQVRRADSSSILVFHSLPQTLRNLSNWQRR